MYDIKKTKCVEDWEGYRDCIWGGWLGLVDFPSFSIKKRLLLSVHHVPKVHVVGIHSMLTSARHLFPVLAFWPRFFLLHSTDVFLHPLCLPQLLLRDHLTTDSVVWHTASYADPTVESEQTGSSLSAAEKCNTSYCTVSPPRSSSHSTEIWRVSKMSSFEKKKHVCTVCWFLSVRALWQTTACPPGLKLTLYWSIDKCYLILSISDKTGATARVRNIILLNWQRTDDVQLFRTRHWIWCQKFSMWSNTLHCA